MKFGSAFSENLTVERKQKRLFFKDTLGWWSGYGRFLLFTLAFLLCIFSLLWRLFDLTVIRGHAYRAIADGNRTKELIRRAPRGILVDRTGKPLVENILEEKGDPRYPEVYYRRHYLYPDATAHVVGYINEISPKELQEDYYQIRGYVQGDHIGRIGAEEVFEEQLRGRDGKELVEVDVNGNILRTLGRVSELPGETVQLSLDASLSEIVKQGFPQDAKGTVVVAKPETGEILALYSSPTFMPTESYDTILENPDKPLFNRAIGGAYPPGSIFKIVTAIAGLEERVIKKDTLVEDIGVITIGPFTFPNWYFTQYGKTDGMVDIVKALKRSNDIFFYKVGEWLGITKLSTWARKVGIGKPLGIELSGEAGGLVPDPAWKNAMFRTPEDLEKRNNEWYLGDTYHVAIGQGYLLVTPLQVNGWTNVIANGGKLCTPTITKVKSQKSKVESCKDLHIKKETIDLITRGMQEACEEGGTGWPLFGFKVPVACKTGTAEYGDIVNNKTHAWFIVFAPVIDPEISVTVLLEGAGEGSDKAAPVAKKILEEWFRR